MLCGSGWAVAGADCAPAVGFDILITKARLSGSNNLVAVRIFIILLYGSVRVNITIVLRGFDPYARNQGYRTKKIQPGLSPRLISILRHPPVKLTSPYRSALRT